MMDLDGGDRKGGIRKRRERRWRKIKKTKLLPYHAVSLK